MCLAAARYLPVQLSLTGTGEILDRLNRRISSNPFTASTP